MAGDDRHHAAVIAVGNLQKEFTAETPRRRESMKTWVHNQAQATVFDEIATREAAERGIARAANGNNAVLDIARDIARRIAQRQGTVTADDVIREMVDGGYRGDELGNAAGGLFKHGFRFTGEYVASKRVASHGRMIRVWELA